MGENIAMSFILVPNRGEDVQINGWNWRPTLELLRTKGLLNDEMYERMSAQGCGGEADAGLAARMADVVESKLAEMRPGERVLADLGVTAKPKSGDIFAEDVYSATYDWLVTFRDFCRCSGGFRVM